MTKEAPIPLGGQTRICKSVLAYNSADFRGRSVWDLTGIQGLFSGSPVVADETVYDVITHTFSAGQRLAPDEVAEHAGILGATTAIITHVLGDPPGASAAYWPIAADMLGSFLESDDGVAIIGEGAEFVRLLLVTRDHESLVPFVHAAMTGH